MQDRQQDANQNRYRYMFYIFSIIIWYKSTFFRLITEPKCGYISHPPPSRRLGTREPVAAEAAASASIRSFEVHSGFFLRCQRIRQLSVSANPACGKIPPPFWEELLIVALQQPSNEGIYQG